MSFKNLPFLFPFGMLQWNKGGIMMANYGKHDIAVRLLLLKQFLEANAGQHRYGKRSELEAFTICLWRKKPSMRICLLWKAFSAMPTRRATASFAAK